MALKVSKKYLKKRLYIICSIYYMVQTIPYSTYRIVHIYHIYKHVIYKRQHIIWFKMVFKLFKVESGCPATSKINVNKKNCPQILQYIMKIMSIKFCIMSTKKASEAAILHNVYSSGARIHIMKIMCIKKSVHYSHNVRFF